MSKLEQKQKMATEKSCGAIVFTRINNKVKYLLVQNLVGIYGFPKGHVEMNETEEQTAQREILEEVGLRVSFIPDVRFEDEIFLKKKNISKKIVYFLAEYSQQEFHYQKEELMTASLVDYETAMSLLQFESLKRILTTVNNLLNKQKTGG